MKYVRMMAMLLMWGAVSALPASVAKAGIINIDLTGWQAFGGFDVNPFNGSVNTFALPNIGAGSTITNITYSNLNFTAEGASWLEELVISVNASDSVNFWDKQILPSGAPNDGPGNSGNLNGDFNGPIAQTAGGQFAVLPDGVAYVTLYELFNDGGNATRDSIINSGTLTIEFVTAVPEPSTYAMMVLAMTVGGGIAARRKMKKAKA